MPRFVEPKVFLVGYTVGDVDSITAYLNYTNQTEFLNDWHKAVDQGITPGEALCSLYAKLCYKSLVPGKNANVQRTRSVKANLEGAFNQGHGSVFEHCQLNFVVTDCSRVYTHEQVRARAGWAYSQTSGRYCRLDTLDFVWDPSLEPVKDLVIEHLKAAEDAVYLMECRLGLRKPPAQYPHVAMNAAIDSGVGYMARKVYPDANDIEYFRWVPDDSFDFEKRKKLTSAIRRIAPNGQANEMGMSVNIRALRHWIQLRTARFAEREIRYIAGQVYTLVKAKFPLIFHGAREEWYEGLKEISGMRQQPYDIAGDDPRLLRSFPTDVLHRELGSRDGVDLATGQALAKM